MGPATTSSAARPATTALDGGPGDDSLEFAARGAHAGVGAGADDLHGGTGVDLLSYLDHTSAIRLALDELPGDGSSDENDNVHNDVETVIATRLADTLTGDDLGQDLYGHAGNDTIDGGGGNDLLNGGTGDDVIRGGPGGDAVEGSAGGDFIDGGPGRDLFAGDNECTDAAVHGRRGPDPGSRQRGGHRQLRCRRRPRHGRPARHRRDRQPAGLREHRPGGAPDRRARHPLPPPPVAASAQNEPAQRARDPQPDAEGDRRRGDLPRRLSHPRRA